MRLVKNHFLQQPSASATVPNRHSKPVPCAQRRGGLGGGFEGRLSLALGKTAQKSRAVEIPRRGFFQVLNLKSLAK
jgi:hypothetical protein